MIQTFLFSLRGMLEQGGAGVFVIAVVTFVLWALLCERWLYLAFGAKRDADLRAERWRQVRDRESWSGREIRRMWLGELDLRLRRSSVMIRALVGLCPLLGLVGTVVGMIEVFDGILYTGSSNVRALTSGISKATLSTLAGMLAALSGLLAGARLDRLADRRRASAEEALEFRFEEA